MIAADGLRKLGLRYPASWTRPQRVEDRFVSRKETQRADYFDGALDTSHEGRLIARDSLINTAKINPAPGKKMPRHKTGAKKKVDHHSNSTAFPASR